MGNAAPSASAVAKQEARVQKREERLERKASIREERKRVQDEKQSIKEEAKLESALQRTGFDLKDLRKTSYISQL